MIRRGRTALVAAALLGALLVSAPGAVPAVTASDAFSTPVPALETVKSLAELAAEHPPGVMTETVDEGLGTGQAETESNPGVPDPVQQTSATGTGDSHTELTDPIVNFQAQNGGSPPDTVGDVGPNQYVQMVNTTIAVYDKAGNTLAGPTAINTLWAGQDDTQAACRDNNAGDPIVLYDQQVDRWMVSQFTSPSTPQGPNNTFPMCIAYSQTADATGNWYLYQFNLPRSHDYMKYGIWPDGLYMSTFQGDDLGVYVFDRAKMLEGSPAAFVDGGEVEGGTAVGNRANRILPADWDGEATPAAGDPNWFLQSKDDEFDGGVDRLELFGFTVDWNAQTASFAAVATLPTAAFSTNLSCSPNFRACVPQPNTSNKVDDLANRLMHRLQYRNFGSYESMVVSQTVDADGNDRAGVRWYELRRTGGGVWAIHQQGTYAPNDGVHRWMPSAAMDGEGNIALGYSVSDATATFPGIRYTGRLAHDPLGSMPQGEHIALTGANSLTTSNRWGDYSSMNVDPVDECTFWYTQMFIGASEARSTQVTSFRFPSCNDIDLRLTKDAPAEVAAGREFTYDISVRNAGSDTATNVVVTDDLPAGIDFVSSAPGCTAAGQQLTCELGNILAGQTKQLAIVVEVPADFLSSSSQSVVNVATAEADQLDTAPGNNTDDATTTIVESADLAVAKLCQADTATPDTTAGTCWIYVDNLGPSYARNVEVTDVITSDAPFTVTSMTSSDGGTCTTPLPLIPETSKTVTCDLGTEPTPGRTTITVEIQATTGAEVTDIASATSDSDDPNTSNNSATGSLSISSSADLAVDKTASPTTVLAGEQLTYTMTVTNSGPSPAENVVLKDVLPAPLTFASAAVDPVSAGSCGHADGVVTCNLGTIAVDPVTVTVVTDVPAAATDGTVVANEATVTSATADPDNSDNIDSASATIAAAADLAIVKTSEGAPVAGTVISYRYAIDNDGPSWARDVHVIDELPDGMQFVSAFLAVGGNPVGAPLECDEVAVGSNTWSCPLGDLGPTAPEPLEAVMNVRIDSDVPKDTALTNTARASSDTADPNPSNDQDSVTVIVETVADVVTVKTSDADIYSPSSTVKYTITLTNNGPSDAQQVVAFDYLPGTKQAVYRFDTGGCTKDGLVLTCIVGTLPAGATHSFNVYVTIRGSEGRVDNTAKHTASTFDPNVSNNTSTRTILIQGGLHK